MKGKLRVLAVAAALLVGTPAEAQIYRAVLSGQNEIPAAATQGSGFGIVTLNRTTHEMRVSANFSGLVGLTTASHIHCCVVQPANAGVATTSPTFVGFPLGVSSGSWDRIYDMSQTTTWNAPFITGNGGTNAGAESAFLAGVAAGQSYLNIHSTTFPGGEIRGNLELFRFAGNSSLKSGSIGVATALDSLGAGTGKLSDALVGMAFLAAAPQAAAVEKLAPISSRGRLVVTTGHADTNFDQISNRLDVLRRAKRNNALESRNGLWFNGGGVADRQDLDDDFAGYKSDGWGLAGGYDRELQSGTFIGGGLGYADSSIDYRDQSAGSNDDIDTRQISFYASHDAGRFYVQGMFSYGWQQYENSRDTGSTGAATSSYDGNQSGFRINAGAPFSLSSAISFTPQVRVNWNDVKQDAYSETSSGVFGLQVAAKSEKRVRTALGGQLDFGTGGASLLPYVRAFWNHDYENGGRDTTSTFLAGGTDFITPGQQLDGDAASLGAGVNFLTKGPFAAAFTYDATFTGSHQSHAIQGRAHWSF